MGDCRRHGGDTAQQHRFRTVRPALQSASRVGGSVGTGNARHQENEKEDRPMKSMAARLFRTMVAAAALAALIAGEAFAQETLSVGGLSGGIWAESFRTALITPFGQQFKVATKSEEGISAVVLAKLRQQKGNPQFDVVFMDRGVSDLAIREGLVEPVSATVQAGASDVIPEAFIKNAKGENTA